MFGNKKDCEKCGKKVNRDYDFCPSCGYSFNQSKDPREYGILGKNDKVSGNNVNLPVGFNMIFNSLIKNLDKQFKEMESELKKNRQSPERNNRKRKNPSIPQKGLSIKIVSSKNGPPEIKINSYGPQEQQEIRTEIIEKKIKEESLKNIKNLPREEPLTTIRRFSDRVVYEINIPGVESIDDVSINRLENSIEIKAIAKDKVYTKHVPFALPILNYKFQKDKLVLELDNSE
jgi:hypothetical protein